MCQPSYGDFNHHSMWDRRCSPNLMRLQLLTERNLISHNIIANSGQFIAQRFSGKTSIGLGHFAVVIASEMLVVSSGQMGGFGEGPAQVAIAVFTVAMALSFAV